MSWLQNLQQRYRAASDPLRTERQLELVLVAMAVLLALLVLYGLLRLALMSPPETVLPAEDSLQVGRVAPRFQPEAADSLEIRARPLFWAGRRPHQEVPEAATEPEPEDASTELKGVKLVGVFGAGESAGIIVQGKNGKRRLLVGQEVDGWELTSVNPNEVKLARSGETRALVLKQQAIAAAPRDTADADSVEDKQQTKTESATKRTYRDPRLEAAARRRAAAMEDDELRPGGSTILPKKK